MIVGPKTYSPSRNSQAPKLQNASASVYWIYLPLQTLGVEKHHSEIRRPFVDSHQIPNHESCRRGWNETSLFFTFLCSDKYCWLLRRDPADNHYICAAQAHLCKRWVKFEMLWYLVQFRRHSNTRDTTEPKGVGLISVWECFSSQHPNVHHVGTWMSPPAGRTTSLTFTVNFTLHTSFLNSAWKIKRRTFHPSILSVQYLCKGAGGDCNCLITGHQFTFHHCNNKM